MSSSRLGLMSPEGDLTAAGAPGGAPDRLASPPLAPPANAREVPVLSLETWRGTSASRGSIEVEECMGHPDGTTVRNIGHLRQVRVCSSWRRKTYSPLEPPWRNIVNIELMSKQKVFRLDIKSSSRQNGHTVRATSASGAAL